MKDTTSVNGLPRMFASALLLTGLLCGKSMAEHQPGHPTPPTPGDAHAPPFKHNDWRAPHQGMKPPPVDRWLAMVRERDPAQYERLIHLREQDPDAFFREMQMLRDTHHARRMLNKRPRIADVIGKLPPDDQRWLLQHMKETQAVGPERSGQENRYDELRADIRRLVELYRKAASDKDRAGIRASIEDTSEQLFNLREQERLRQIRRAEEMLDTLKAEHESRQEQKDSIIRDKVDQLLGPRPGSP